MGKLELQEISLPTRLLSKVDEAKVSLEKQGLVRTIDFGWVKQERLTEAITHRYIHTMGASRYGFIYNAVLAYTPDQIVRFLQGQINTMKKVFIKHADTEVEGIFSDM